jgi:hypothetical protein
MAIIDEGTAVQVIGSGIRQTSPEKDSFVVNMIYTNESWEVRKGFGTLGEWDTTLSRYTEDPGFLVETGGYEKHLGSYLMTTDFGHRQIISVFTGRSWTSNGVTLPTVETIFDGLGRSLPVYLISIYDITSGHRWEELITHPTSEQDKTIGLMPTWHGWNETNIDNKYGSVKVAASDEQIAFTEFNDILYFGNPSMGILYYKPCVFMGNRIKAVDGVTNQSSSHYSESSVVDRLRLMPGEFANAYTYTTVLPKVNTLAKLENRLLHVTDTRIYFSDQNFPASIVAGNFLEVPGENIITAVKEINGNLLIWTNSETFLYQPNPAFLPNTGALIKLSETVGCLSPNSLIKYENTIIWVDKNGVYTNGGGLQIQYKSENIKKFFTNYISNPLAHYELTLGITDTTRDQPKIEYSLDTKYVTACYSHQLRAVLFTFPGERCTLVLNENNEWSMWMYDSAAFQTGGNNAVGIHTYMDAQQLVSDEQNLYSVGLDLNSKITTDWASTWTAGAWAQNVNVNQTFKSYFICRYGRGGGCDRNVDNEDYRYGIGTWAVDPLQAVTGLTDAAGVAWVGNDQSALGGYFEVFIGQPQKVSPGYKFDGTEMVNGGILLPVEIRVPKDAMRAAGNWGSDTFPTILEISFEFDRFNWKPLVDDAQGAAGNARSKFILKTPMTRLQGGFGQNTVDFAMARYRECAFYNITPPLAYDSSVNGGLCRIGWNANDAALAPAGGPSVFNTNTHFPQIEPAVPIINPSGIPTPLDKKTTIVWIPFERNGHVVGPVTNYYAVSSMAVRNTRGVMWVDSQGTAPIGGDNYYRSRNYIWNFSDLGNSSDTHINDNVCQGVDWAYSSIPVGIEQGVQIKNRGVYAQVLSHGTASDMIPNAWTDSPASRRLYNTVVSNDNTQWMAQVVDYQPGPEGFVNNRPFEPTAKASSPLSINGALVDGVFGGIHNTIRTRFRQTNMVMGYKVFGITGGSKFWGGSNTDTGTILIDDPQYGTIADSNSTRGEWISWMFFGHVLNKAEKLILKTANVIVKQVAGRRRVGR